MKLFLVLLGLVCAPAALSVRAIEIRQVEVDNSLLIDTSPVNYALSSPALLSQYNWKSVSVNGDQMIAITANCQTIIKSTQTIEGSEKSQLMAEASKLVLADSIANPSYQGRGRHLAARFSLLQGGSVLRSSRTEGASMSSFNLNGISLNKFDEQHYSIGKPGLPNGLGRVFVNGDLVTMVYLNGQVQMKPIACLQASEKQLLDQLQGEAQRAQQQFQANMNQMQHNLNKNMQQMQQNLQQSLQQSMQQMQHNMANNMFQAGFPFNSQANFNPFAGAAATNAALPGLGQAFAAPNSYAGAYVAPPQMAHPFGNNFPFGPNNSPFGPGFPFNQ